MRQVTPDALQRLDEQGGFLIPVEIRRIQRQVGKILLHVGPVLVQEWAGIIRVWVHLDANHPDAACWKKLQTANRQLKEQIEHAWEAEGLLTFNGLLRQELAKK